MITDRGYPSPEEARDADIIADFFYTPFIKLGEWLSARYRKINVLTTILDLLIEMPLKTTLRILQEWVRFMRDKREGF